MAQHGYLREYDEDWDRSDQRNRWRDEDREGGWRGGDRDWSNRSERDRNFMLGERDRSEQDRGRGFFGPMGDEAQGRFGGDRDRFPRHFSSRQDDHYLSWRDRQMDALDRDYADYCREREAQFHRDFDSWRINRHGNPEPLRTGMTQTGLSADPTGELQLTSDEEINPTTGPDPTETATLGTPGGRGQR